MMSNYQHLVIFNVRQLMRKSMAVYCCALVTGGENFAWQCGKNHADTITKRIAATLKVGTLGIEMSKSTYGSKISKLF